MKGFRTHHFKFRRLWIKILKETQNKKEVQDASSNSIFPSDVSTDINNDNSLFIHNKKNEET